MVALSQSICCDDLLGSRHRGIVGFNASMSTLQASPVVGRVQPSQSDSVLDVAPCLQQQFNQRATLHHDEIFPHNYEIRCLIILSSGCNVLPDLKGPLKTLKNPAPPPPRLEGAGTHKFSVAATSFHNPSLASELREAKLTEGRVCLKRHKHSSLSLCLCLYT